MSTSTSTGSSAEASTRSDTVDAINDIPSWQHIAQSPSLEESSHLNDSHRQQIKNIIESVKEQYPANRSLNEKISLYQGDITKLRVDAVVNAANEGLWAGGGICGAIFKAAGRSELEDECAERYPNGCPTGQTVVTSGQNLPAKYILHTVAPTNKSEELMESCYHTIYKQCLNNNIRSVAICCIGTGIFGFPNVLAASIALRVTRQCLEQHSESVDKVVFCTFLPLDKEIYQHLLPVHFPTDNNGSDNTSNSTANTLSSSSSNL